MYVYIYIYVYIYYMYVSWVVIGMPGEVFRLSQIRKAGFLSVGFRDSIPAGCLETAWYMMIYTVKKGYSATLNDQVLPRTSQYMSILQHHSANNVWYNSRNYSDQKSWEFQSGLWRSAVSYSGRCAWSMFCLWCATPAISRFQDAWRGDMERHWLVAICRNLI